MPVEESTSPLASAARPAAAEMRMISASMPSSLRKPLFCANGNVMNCPANPVMLIRILSAPKKPLPPGQAAPGRFEALPRSTRILRFSSRIKQHAAAFLAPGSFIRRRRAVQVFRRCRRVVDPLTQKLAAVDQIDRQPIALVLVGKIAPEIVIGPQ